MNAESKILGTYKNGNYNVVIFNDGTKIRHNKLDNLTPHKPENIDIKICNKCDMGCPMCHENSTPDGECGDIMNLPFIDTLLPYSELAIGGGNPLEHPELVNFLYKLRERNIIPNITVNQTHFMKSLDFIKELCDKQLVFGVGVSLVSPTDEFISAIKQFPNAVIHVINGIVTFEQLHMLYDNDLKILILGYKHIRRGDEYYKTASPLIKKNQDDMYDLVSTLPEHFKVVSFDNLAIEQLDVQSLMSVADWESFYMGDDGSYTMYIDVVNREFAKSSTSLTRYPLTDDIEEMFNIVRSENS